MVPADYSVDDGISILHVTLSVTGQPMLLSQSTQRLASPCSFVQATDQSFVFMLPALQQRHLWQLETGQADYSSQSTPKRNAQNYQNIHRKEYNQFLKMMVRINEYHQVHQYIIVGIDMKKMATKFFALQNIP